MTDLPFCSLSPDALSQRLASWSDLDGAIVARRRTASAAEVVFRPEPGIAERLVELVDAEATCCPGLKFDVTITLTVQAPEGMLNQLAWTIEALQAHPAG